jgi:hypothetical protein
MSANVICLDPVRKMLWLIRPFPRWPYPLIRPSSTSIQARSSFANRIASAAISSSRFSS